MADGGAVSEGRATARLVPRWEARAKGPMGVVVKGGRGKVRRWDGARSRCWAQELGFAD